MQIRLAENIRALRRQHRFTQEQLAEGLGVTPGAVYKWEAGLSQPELAIIVELADLFDTSVDVLLGYEMKDNRRQTAAERLQRYRVEKDRTGLAEAEKALQKYPNDFEIVYRSAALYRVFGIVETDEALLRRALALLEKARLLLPQNTDPKLSETVLYAETAQTLSALGEGYLCGENGSGLSGGEKQRISIARSLLKHASVLLADEATAALDAQTAHQVTDDILSLTGVTRIVVTHTLEQAALRRYDGILVLKDGRIAESGSFDALMVQKGYFYVLYTVSQ